MDRQFNQTERKEILEKFFDIFEKSTKMTAEYDSMETENEDAKIALDELGRQCSELWDRYYSGVPVKALSRCPFTGDTLLHSIDTLGLNGLWWNSDSPLRPDTDLPATYFAMDGALKITGEIEKAPFICTPGPEVPYVLPRLLEYTQVKAVISSIRVGNHVAYPVFYFADPMLYGVERVNDWGSKNYAYIDEYGEKRWDASIDDPSDYDFELEKWIKKGKLLWIYPDDPNLTLHSDVSRCPYLNLKGSRNKRYIQNGIMWEHEVDEDESQDSSETDFSGEYMKSIIESLEKGEY